MTDHISGFSGLFILPALDNAELVRVASVARNWRDAVSVPWVWAGRRVELTSDPARSVLGLRYLSLWTSVELAVKISPASKVPSVMEHTNDLLSRLAVQAPGLTSLCIPNERYTWLSTWRTIADNLASRLQELEISNLSVKSTLCASTNEEARGRREWHHPCNEWRWIPGAHPLLQVVSKCTRLRRFTGHSCFCDGTELLEALAAATGETLREVDVSWNTGITLNGIASFAKAAPNLERFTCILRNRTRSYGSTFDENAALRVLKASCPSLKLAVIGECLDA